MGSIEYGVKQAIENCLRVKEYEKIVIITAKNTLKISNALKDAAEKRTKNIEFYLLDDYLIGKKAPSKCPKEILDAIKKTDVSIYCVSSKWYRRNQASIVDDLFKTILKKEKIRHAHMPCITEEIMRTGMCVDYSEVQRVSKEVYNIIKSAKKINVTTKRGTDFTAEFSPGTKWLLCDSLFGGKIENLPSGELSATPTHIEGYAIIDGWLGDIFNRKYKDLKDNPVELEMKKNRVVEGSVKCKDSKLEKEFADCLFKMDKNNSRVGFFGMGTNVGLDKVIGNLLQDEKLPGPGIIFGTPSYLPLTKWKSKVVCDSWIRDATVLVDGKKLMDKGKFLV